MRSKLFILFSCFIVILNTFHCNGDTNILTLPGQRLLTKSTFYRSPRFAKVLIGKRSVDQVETVEDYDYNFHDEEEPQCSENEFYHVRGFRCVPFECPGGNQFRDRHNGECILKTYGVSRGVMKERPSRFLNSRMKSPTKFRLPFGLTLKG